MAGKREARLWQMLGGSFMLGGAVPLVVNIENFRRTMQVDAESLKVGVWCSLMVLAGLAAMVGGRIVRSTDDPDTPKHSWIWTPLAFLGMPLGAFLFELQWEQTHSFATSLNQKAVLLAGAFVFSAGLIAMVGERVVNHTRSVAASRSDLVARRADMAARLVRIS